MKTEHIKRNFHIHAVVIKLLLLGFILLLSPPHSGRAASIIMVNSPHDEKKNDGTCTLREAVIAANKDQRSGGKPGECIAGSGADTILLPAGSYFITKSDNGNEDSSATGDLDIVNDVTIMGDGADVTTIEGVDITDRIFHVITGTATISGVTITGGNVPQDGGGLYNLADLTLTDVAVNGNHAQENGAGIYNIGTLVMTGSTVANNTAVLDSYELINTGTVTITNSTISDSDFDNTDAGLSNSGTANLNFVTVMGETAVPNGTLNATNTIFTACSGTITSQGYNLIADTTGCTITGDATGNIINQSSLLDVLADNGGPTPTHALLDGSPAIEAGSNTNCPATDQRGISRPRGAFCDIGAYEDEDPTQSSDTVIVNTDEDGEPGACTLLHCTLREAIIAANDTADNILFNISGSAPYVIQPLSELPPLTMPIILDGSTQPGGIVILDGSLAGAAANGLTLTGGSSTIRGLAITNFGCSGLVLDSSGNLVEANTITGNGCHGVQVLTGSGNTIRDNSITNNTLLGISLEGDKPTTNDVGDSDGDANGKQNYPILTSAVNYSGTISVTGRLNSTAVTTYTLEFFSDATCDDSNHGEGGTSLDTLQVMTDGAGNALFALPVTAPSGSFISATATDVNGSTSEFSHCAVVADFGNTIWPNALPLEKLGFAPDMSPTAVEQYLDQEGQSRWYKLVVQPNSRLNITLSNLAANYDVTVYKDIREAFNTLVTTEDLTKLSAEFAPNAFNPDSLAPDAFSSDAFAPDAFLPDAFLPDAFLPDAFLPDAFLPDAFLPDDYSPDAFLPDAFLPDAFLPDAFLPDAFLSAQTRSLVAISAFNGTADEHVSLNTWLNDGNYYIRVRGRQGAYSLATPFRLEAQLLSGGCSDVSPITTDISTLPVAGNFKTLILTDMGRMTGSSDDETVLSANLAALAARSEVAGEIVDVGLDAKVAAANAQADLDGTNGAPNNQGCPYAKNLVVEAIKEIVDGYRVLNPDLAYIVIIGNDEVIPFQRYPDLALLANEKNYIVPVLDDTHSESSLRLGYILTQDGYGSSVDVSLKTNQFPVPGLPVGRLVETMADVNIALEAYLGTSDGTVDTPDQIAATGYDFIEDAARAIVDELEAGTGAVADTLILTHTLSPQDPLAWTAVQAADLLLNNRQDLTFLGGHFSANSMLAADYTTRLTTGDLAASPVDMTNSIIFSLGCHAGYNIVNEHGVPDVTNILDWPQAVMQKGGTLIASTGFAYGHTDFLKYSERLHLLFSQQLRTGTGAVSIGNAMVAAKQLYLATTPELRGIDEKSLLATTIYGLPMLSVDMPGDRLTSTGDSSIVNSTTAFGSNPGATLGLTYADITVNPSLTLNVSPLTNVADGTDIRSATYLSGTDGVVANPSEIVLPLEIENVHVAGTVLRGVGFRGGSYSDLAGILPLTGAPVTEIRGVHTPFLSNVFYPVKMWQTNYFDVLVNPDSGQTRLVFTPAQFQSDSPGSETGILRQYSRADFRLYYSNNIQDYGGSVPALSAAPTIAKVTAVAGTDSIYIQAIITGNPAAGVQEVWVVYTDGNGQWVPLDLVQNTTDTKLWERTLDLNGTPAEDISFMVQAVNGVGLVSMDTNQGAFHGVGANVPGTTATNLTWELPATDGAYGDKATFSAVLTSGGTPLANQPVFISLGSQARVGVTDGNGRATVQMTLLSLPGTYQVQAIYQGIGSFSPSSDMANFTITKHPTTLILEPEDATGFATDSNIMEAALSAGARRLTEKTVFFVVEGAGGGLSRAVITDNEGEAVLGDVHLPAGQYDVTAYFSGQIILHSGIELNLDDSRYISTTVTGTLTLLNTPPAAAADAYSTDEDVVLVVDAPGVLGNDSDINGDALGVILDTAPAHGILNFNANGSFTYIPALDFSGSDSFSYRADDGLDTSDTTTVTITVNEVNDPPAVQDDVYSVDEDNTLTVAAPGVLGNDSDEEGMPLTAAFQSTTANGTLTLNTNGSFSYTPAANFNGSDSFTYVANDGNSDSAVATVTITINGVNDAPVAADDSAVTNEDTAVNITVLFNDNDVDGDALTVGSVTTAAQGTVSHDGAVVTYTPADDYCGSDSFGYTVVDGNGGSDMAVVTITITCVNDAPVAVDDAYSVLDNTTLDVTAPGVLGNDSDIDSAGLMAVLDTSPANGTLTLNSDGSFSYTPDAGFIGDDTFTYVANDGLLNSSVATVTITVNPSNTDPGCGSAAPSIMYIWPPDNNFVPVNILNVTDDDGDTVIITIDAIHQDERTGHGNNSPDGYGIGTDTAYVRAERAGNSNGRVYHITFTATDGHGGSCFATIRMPVVDHDNSDLDAIDEGPLYDSTVEN